MSTIEQASSSSNPRVYFDIELNGQPSGRIVMELFKNVTPRTAENFRKLCTGEAGISKLCGKPLSYKGSIFHRVIRGFMMQGGDFTKFNGTGGESIYGEKFPDENFRLKHTQKGLLSMANAGRNTNGSQFFLTFEKTPWLDGKHVVFGKVVQGYDICQKVERIPVNQNDKPNITVRIKDCGEIKPEAPKVPVAAAAVAVPAAPTTEGAKLATTEEAKHDIPAAAEKRASSSDSESSPEKKEEKGLLLGHSEKSKKIKKHKKKHKKHHKLRHDK